MIILLGIVACGCGEDEYPEFEVQSIAFAHGDTIPERHTCDGDHISPPLSFSDYPVETLSFAIIMEDPDAPLPPYVHWVAWGIPASLSFVSEDQNNSPQPGISQGVNDKDESQYYGPCPPENDEHRYVFHVYALDVEDVNIREDSTKKNLQDAMDGHIVGKGELMGLYER